MIYIYKKARHTHRTGIPAFSSCAAAGVLTAATIEVAGTEPAKEFGVLCTRTVVSDSSGRFRLPGNAPP